MNLIRAARVSSLNLANQIYIGDARRFRGRAVAARLHRIKYCVGRCSQSLILSQFFSGCGGGCGAYIVLMVYVVRALYTPVDSPTGFCMGYQPSQRRVGVFLARCWKSDRAATSRLRSRSWWLPRATFSLSVGDGDCRIAVVIVMTTTATAVASVVVTMLALLPGSSNGCVRR